VETPQGKGRSGAGRGAIANSAESRPPPAKSTKISWGPPSKQKKERGFPHQKKYRVGFPKGKNYEKESSVELFWEGEG